MPRVRTYRMGYYVLDANNNPVQYPDQKMIAWAMALEELRIDGRDIVKQDHIGDNFLSTVFLGLDHSFSRMIEQGVGSPHIFETMAFAPADGRTIKLFDITYTPTLGESFYQARYSTWKEALEGHESIAQWMKLSIDVHAKKEEQ